MIHRVRGKRREIKCFGKLPHIPGNLGGHVYIQDYAHAQNRPEKVL